jgi:hypothetical protein
MAIRWQEAHQITVDIMRDEEFVKKAGAHPQAALEIFHGYDALVGGADLSLRPGGLPDP